MKTLMCHKYIKTLILCFFVFSNGAAYAEKDFDPGKKIPVEQITEDFRVFRTAFEEGHAGLYQYASKEEMDGQFDRIQKELDKPLTEMEFFRYLAYLVSAVNDGHTAIHFSKAYQDYLDSRPILFPFDIRFIHNRAYILRNFSRNENLVPGGRILFINNRMMMDILGDMMAFVPSDGHIKTARYHRLQNGLYFGRLFFMLFGESPQFIVTYLSPVDGMKREIAVKGLTRKERDAVRRQRFPEIFEEKPPIEVEYRGNTAVLKIRTFSDGAYRKADIIYPLFLKQTFTAFAEKNISSLVIDLRDNGGGADLFGKLLCSYLLPKPYLYYESLRVNDNSFSFLPYTDQPDLNSFLERWLKPSEKSRYEVRSHPNLGTQKPLSPTFEGNVYVLINGGSFSGSGEATSILHHHRRAVFIGEECGAGYYGNTSGIMPLVTLPHSKLRIRLPLVRYVLAVSGYAHPDRGIIPDFPFSPDIRDLLAQEDTAMAYVLGLIQKKTGAENADRK